MVLTRSNREDVVKILFTSRNTICHRGKDKGQLNLQTLKYFLKVTRLFTKNKVGTNHIH